MFRSLNIASSAVSHVCCWDTATCLETLPRVYLQILTPENITTHQTHHSASSKLQKNRGWSPQQAFWLAAAGWPGKDWHSHKNNKLPPSRHDPHLRTFKTPDHAGNDSQLGPVEESQLGGPAWAHRGGEEVQHAHRWCVPYFKQV